MSQKSDPLEVPGALGPLFGRTDPKTSRVAAKAMTDYGRVAAGQRHALYLVRTYPGKTCPELGALAAGINPSLMQFDHMQAISEQERQRIGRRLNELTNPPGPGHVIGKPHLIERRGERDGCSCWWPV